MMGGGRPMNKRQRAQQIANAIKEAYHADKVVVCWTQKQARRYDAITLGPYVIGFACTYRMENGDDVTAVIPIAKNVIFNKKFDFADDILLTAGRFLMNHFNLEMAAEELRAE